MGSTTQKCKCGREVYGRELYCPRCYNAYRDYVVMRDARAREWFERSRAMERTLLDIRWEYM